ELEKHDHADDKPFFRGDYLVGRDPNELVWPGSWWQQSAKMLQMDLEEAGIVAIDDDRVVDFHALRTTFITGLARAGVAPALTQKLARHSDINLTLSAYTRLQMSELAGAVGRLAIVALPRTQHEPRVMAAS
ncbi:MAG: tyrosine-type recombinase/integrase, partial [Pirellulales bacterium]